MASTLPAQKAHIAHAAGLGLARAAGFVSVEREGSVEQAGAVFGRTRLRPDNPDAFVLPDLATAREQGLAGFDSVLWLGLSAPGGTPAAIVERLNAEVRKALAVPEVKTKLESMGGDGKPTSPEEMRALVAKQYATWSKLAREANISID